MEKENQISLRLKEVLIDGKWIANTNYKEILSDVTWEQANIKIGSLNTILALTFHINYYVEGVLQVFTEEKLTIQDKYSFDFHNIKNEKDWDNLLSQLNVNTKKLYHHISTMSKDNLDQTFVNEKYGDYRRNINGLIEHSYYHLGQISLIKKMVLEM